MEKKNLKINYATKAIEVKESFARKAGIVGSDEYNALKELQSEHPNYTIVVIKRAKSEGKKNTTAIKGITTKMLYEYAEKHEKGDSVKRFAELKAEKASFFSVKKEFLDRYTEFQGFKTKGEWLYALSVA